MFLSLLLVCGADPVPTFKVENRTFVVVNKIAPVEKPQTVPGVAPRPGEPVKVTPGVVINRPFSETPAVIIAPEWSGTVASMPGAEQWSRPSPVPTVGLTHILAPGAVVPGGTNCTGFT